LEHEEKKALYRLAKLMLMAVGAVLIAYGGFILFSGLFLGPQNGQYWFGIFPIYLGSMMILISLAMKVEWFTDTRRFW
jgi:hypothetical protein